MRQQPVVHMCNPWTLCSAHLSLQQYTLSWQPDDAPSNHQRYGSSSRAVQLQFLCCTDDDVPPASTLWKMNVPCLLVCACRLLAVLHAGMLADSPMVVAEKSSSGALVCCLQVLQRDSVHCRNALVSQCLPAASGSRQGCRRSQSPICAY